MYVTYVCNLYVTCEVSTWSTFLYLSEERPSWANLLLTLFSIKLSRSSFFVDCGNVKVESILYFSIFHHLFGGFDFYIYVQISKHNYLK
jgi:hypothetical protein